MYFAKPAKRQLRGFIKNWLDASVNSLNDPVPTALSIADRVFSGQGAKSCNFFALIRTISRQVQVNCQYLFSKMKTATLWESCGTYSAKLDARKKLSWWDGSKCNSGLQEILVGLLCQSKGKQPNLGYVKGFSRCLFLQANNTKGGKSSGSK